MVATDLFNLLGGLTSYRRRYRDAGVPTTRKRPDRRSIRRLKALENQRLQLVTVSMLAPAPAVGDPLASNIVLIVHLTDPVC